MDGIADKPGAEFGVVDVTRTNGPMLLWSFGPSNERFLSSAQPYALRDGSASSRDLAQIS